MAGLLLCLIVASNLAPSVAVRVAQQALSGEESNASSAFNCPGECQECCSAHEYDIGIVAWGSSSERYKCIPKDHTVLPSEKCSKPQVRSHANNMYKTECPFADKEEWKELKGKECNKFTKCCCDTADDWTENVCLDATDDETTAPSEHEKAKGHQQTYEKTYQAYENGGLCEGNVQAKEFQSTYDVKATTHGKCCVETKTKSTQITVKGSCRMEGGYPCDEDMCAVDATCDWGLNLCGKSQVCDKETKTWTACKKFQALFYCADDKLNPTQTRYKRKSTAKGVCMGDKTEPKVIVGWASVDCPSGYSNYITGRRCQCDNNCGAK